MRYIIGILVLGTMVTRFSTSFYDLSFIGLDGTAIATSAYKGKKVIVLAFNGAHPDIKMLRVLDSVQRSSGDSLQIIAFPALEFDSTVTKDRLTQVRDSLGLQLVISQPARVLRSSGAAQIPLFQWLTSLNGNGHFSRDVEEEGMLFIINRQGNLYSILNRGFYGPVLSKVLKNQGI